jgi:5-methylcytosine-specific restriction endonuclease McrA
MPKPLTAEHYKLQLTIDAETYADLMRLRDLVRHSVPDGGKVVAKAITLARKSVEKRKLGRTEKPKQLAINAAKAERAPDPSRAPSAATRREVSERDKGQCTYVSTDGRRCSATAWLEFDHKHEVAAGGETSTKNLRLYRVHNAARNFTTRPGAHPQ